MAKEKQPRVWVLYAYDDSDEAPILEAFGEDDQPNIGALRETWPAGSFLYEYDLIKGYAENERLMVVL